ncbi:hypothetical protein NORO109296_25325 [Nocardiopsis rhodophaea]
MAGSQRFTDLRFQSAGPRIIVDPAHGNSGKDHNRQPDVIIDEERRSPKPPRYSTKKAPCVNRVGPLSCVGAPGRELGIVLSAHSDLTFSPDEGGR